ncbi:MAG: hypothetical protein PSY12_12000 [bacterium]|nr:hypothetical protein [bacterium]
MTIDIIFNQRIQTLKDLISQGYVAHQDKICSELSALAYDDLAIRFCIDRLASDPFSKVMRGAQSFILMQCNEFMLRINLWFPETKLPSSVLERYDDYFSVGVCHNHNFDFFTLGILGRGYTSKFFETADVLGEKWRGDEIDFSRSWEVSLAQGVSIFVKRDSQFHVQFAPEDFSISLNLIPRQKILDDDRQFIMCRDMRTIDKVLMPISSRTEGLQ